MTQAKTNSRAVAATPALPAESAPAQTAAAIARIYQRVAGTAAYDLTIRVIVAAWFGWTAYRQVEDVGALFAGAETAHGMLTLAGRLSMFLFFGFLALLTLIRHAPILRSRGVLPRMVAVLGTFSLTLLTFLPPAALSVTMQAVSTTLGFAGWALAVYCVLHLGRSVSTMPEARRLVCSGPYRLVRHPLYLAEALALSGMVLFFFSWQAVVIFAVQCTFQYMRMLNEERVLGEAFPDYAAYAARTARVLPGIH